MKLMSSLKENQELSKTKNSQSTAEEINWKSKHIKRNSYSNISILTTRYDEVQDKIHSSEKKNGKLNQEDSILDALKNRGLLDCSTEKKIFEYNQSLKRKESDSARKNNFSYKISLLQEYRIIQKNSSICDTQLANLEYMSQMKNKKIEILENAQNSVNSKIKGNCATGKNNDFTSKSKTENIKNNIHNENKKLINNDNYKSYLENSIKNVKLGNEGSLNIAAENISDNLEAERLRIEIQELKNQIHNEKEDLKDKLCKRNKDVLNAQKAVSEKAKEEKYSDKNFIINNLTLEKDALKKKLEKEESKGFLKNIKANVDLEEETYKQRKSGLLEKINYLKFIIKNTNHEALTSNNSLVANKSINKNPENCLLTNQSKNNCDYNLSNILYNKHNTNQNEICKTIDLKDFSNDINHFQINPKSCKENNKDTNISFEIGLSQIHSNVFNDENFTVNNINKSIAEVNNRSNLIQNLNEYSVDKREVNNIREICPRFLNSNKK